MSKRHWQPCRVCGKDHTNPSSSSICQSCGEAERDARIAAERAERHEFEESAFGQFMSLPDDEKWRQVFDHLEAMRGVS